MSASKSSSIPAKIQRKYRVLLLSMMLIATNGVIYELLIGGYSSYLLGDSITQFSLTIGVFMSAMGLGSWLTQHVEDRLEQRFVEVELWLAFLGGPTILILAMAHIYTRIYSWLMFGFIVALGCLIGFEIPIVTRIMQQHESLKKALAQVLSFDYIGALVGSLLFPWVLLPELGFAKTSFALGIANAGVASVNLWILQDEIGPAKRRLWLFNAFILGCLCVGFWGSNTWIERARMQASQQRLVFQTHSRYQTLRFVRDERPAKPVYRLYLNGDHQFSSDLERNYHELLVHPILNAVPSKQEILLLGAGDGLAVRELLRIPEVQRITLVDLDPAVTHLAQTHPILRKINQDALQSPRVRILHQDADRFVRQTQQRFDAIIIDLPVPTRYGLSKLYTVQFYRQLHRITHPHSLIVTEAAVLNPLEHEPFWCLQRTQQQAGWISTPYTLHTMAFLIMSKHRIHPQKWTLTRPLHTLTTPLLRSAFVLPKDILPKTTPPINTVDTHKLVSLIQRLR
ncbi:MAG: polyamine aminopropyltransferase [Myxococcota bacterium]